MKKSHALVVFLGGLFFGFGLALSGMAKPEVVLSFLRFEDLGLLLVMGAAVVVAAVFYHFLPRLRKEALLGGAFDKQGGVVTKETIFGGVLFGVGWGLSGVCPGAALASIGIGNWPILLAIGAMFIGAYVEGALVEHRKS